MLIPAATASSFPTPNEGTGSLYVSAVDYKLYFQDSYGTEYDLTIGSTPGGELTASNIMIDGSPSGLLILLTMVLSISKIMMRLLCRSKKQQMHI